MQEADVYSPTAGPLSTGYHLAEGTEISGEVTTYMLPWPELANLIPITAACLKDSCYTVMSMHGSFLSRQITVEDSQVCWCLVRSLRSLVLFWSGLSATARQCFCSSWEMMLR